MSKLTTSKRAVTSLSNIQNKLVLPDRFKGTFLEKWSTYWKSLYADYKSMVVDVVTDIQEKPTKAFAVFSGLGVLWQLAKNNPDEIDFRDDIRRYANELMLLGEECQNPKTVDHLKYVEKCCNEGVLRRVNLGIASFLWVDDFDDACDLYKTNCEYIQPSYWSITQRVLDIGIMGKWWNSYRKFEDFDVNM